MFFEDKGEFYIVDLHTPEGLQVCVVPDIWCYYVDDKFCCVWPHFHQTKEIKSRTQPKREWASFYADKRNKTFGSYNEAKAKEITATQKTDLASEPEDLGRGKRVRRMRRPFSPAIDYHLDSSSCSEEEGASQLMKNGLPPAPFLLPVAQSTALSDEGTPGYYSSLPNEENTVSPTQEICSELISAPITSPQSSSEVEDRSMQIHGQVQRKNSGAAGSTYRKESMKVHQDIVVRYQTKTMQYHQLKRSAVS
ncbi:uncharacterized protein LOC123472543 [Daphnia magna]|uniref:uncharacterized protein LOC123472543 n=1 Tax=Daphnia magna TaxID=35525 RepID=UPI001E1BCFE8|nr:uncharacterized protein LOC123472543 [Daphnia magna]